MRQEKIKELKARKEELFKMRQSQQKRLSDVKAQIVEMHKAEEMYANDIMALNGAITELDFIIKPQPKNLPEQAVSMNPKDIPKKKTPTKK